MLHDLRLFARHQPNRTTVTLARSHKDRAFETRHVGTLIRIIGCYSRWLVPSAFIISLPIRPVGPSNVGFLRVARHTNAMDSQAPR